MSRPDRDPSLDPDATAPVPDASRVDGRDGAAVDDPTGVLVEDADEADDAASLMADAPWAAPDGAEGASASPLAASRARAAAEALRPGELEQSVVAAFDTGGPLSRHDPGYAPREPQQRMALAVAQAIAGRDTLVVEAGTGVGKTFAYLVPALLAGGRTLISTATKSLQDQLFMRDLPRLLDTFSLPLRAALLKGRGSYLCLHRLEQARHSAELPDRRAVAQLARIERWAMGTHTGDFSEIDGLDERSPIIPIVSSTRDNCLGTDCPSYRECHVVKARREAMEADLVVVNHHLFFADLVLRDSGVAELLPSVEVAIFDEAHQLPEAGLNFLGRTLGSAQMFDFARDLLAQGLAHARGMQEWQEVAGGVERGARTLRLACAGGRDLRGVLKLRWNECAGRTDFDAALGQVAQALELAVDALATVMEVGPDLARLHERAVELYKSALLFARDPDAGAVRWVDVGTHQVRLIESPLDIREAMQEARASTPKAWVFTSATLGEGEDLGWFTEPAGLGDARTLRVGSPFDYPAHARLYVPKHFPKPSEPDHGESVGWLGARLAAKLGGRTFILTTTLRQLQVVSDVLRQRFEEGGHRIEVLVQGSMPKRQLLQQFVEQPASVLVGSASFWEGIDVPGDALQCVVIDKLPFPPPNDPLVEARVARLESEGRNPFMEYFVAEAAIALKQGAGRLIRTESDRGLLVVCDPRLAGSHYGKRLREALPPMTQVPDEASAHAWLTELKTAHDA
ncbi:ATP-dependent DNA helicase [Roseateles chitosanitabidus]|jgi:ATP-dependent DNA helicase DinG|uniref:ATP-dependent DNA helicase n=1 Tax=Roseateles chitosanitabidus TaxID=65048 RepID=UPI002354ABF6|nr:ATP-dependent DNA helicase [Roseateles chitosanitabidus]